MKDNYRGVVRSPMSQLLMLTFVLPWSKGRARADFIQELIHMMVQNGEASAQCKLRHTRTAP